MSVFKFFYEMILIIVGCLSIAFGTANFLLPNLLSSGGFAGIATITYYLFDIPMGNMIMFLNIPLFFIGYKKFGMKFILKTIFATLLYSKFIDILGNFGGFTTDRLLASLYGGFFIGIGLAIIFKANTSTGGTDLIAQIAQNYNVNVKMSKIIVIIDTLVVISNLIVFKEFEIGLYSAITILIIGKMIDIVFEGINFCKIIYIISEKHDEIMEIINTEINKGATALYARGSYSKKNTMVIMCVTKRIYIEKIKNISKRIDKNSFIIITDAREVYGLGFKN